MPNERPAVATTTTDAHQRSRQFIQDLEAAVTQTPLLDQALRDINAGIERAAMPQVQATPVAPPPPLDTAVPTNATPLTIGLAKLLPCNYPMTLITPVSSRYTPGVIVAFHRPHASPNYSEVRDVQSRAAPFPVLNTNMSAMVVMEKNIIVPYRRKKDIAGLVELAESRGWKVVGEFLPVGSAMFCRNKEITWPSLVPPTTLNVTLGDETAQMIMFMITLGTKPPIDALVPQSILDIIRNAPGMSRLRGMVLAAIKLRLPLDVIAAGSDAMIKWLEDNIKFQPLVASTGQGPDPGQKIVEVRYRLIRRYSGRHWYNRDSVCVGSIKLPDGVVASGGHALEDILWDHANENGDWKQGDPEYGDQEDDDSSRYSTIIL